MDHIGTGSCTGHDAVIEPDTTQQWIGRLVTVRVARYY